MSVSSMSRCFLALALLAVPGGAFPALCAARDNDQTRASGAAPAPVTYEELLRLVKEGKSTAQVLRRLEDSPTQFKLSTAQVAELRRAGASEELITALQRDRPGLSPGSDVTDLLVILDCSGSMVDRMPDGTTKMEAAKKAVLQLIRDYPNGRRLAVILYAHRIGNPKPQGCQDVEVVQPLGEVTDAVKDRLAARIAPVKPVGWTPLATSLKVAGQELRHAKGVSQVIVVTDGMETCGGDPIEEVAALNKQFDLADGVEIIGFIVTPDEKAAVELIAKKSHATYYDSNSAKELDEAIKKARKRAREAVIRKNPGGRRPPPTPPPVRSRERVVWRFDRGYFENEGNRWVSHIRDEPNRTWDEETRNVEYIELLSVQNGRRHRVRLYRDRATSKVQGRDKDFKKVWDGAWD
jgi:Mg-chelatase subunit ChlD